MPQNSSRNMREDEERTMHHSMVGPDDLTRRGKRMRAARQWAPVGIVVVLGVLLAREVSAWGDTGPQILGEIAFQELHLQARAAVYHLKNSRLKVPALPGCHNAGKWA